jgi:MFS family permease
MYITRKLSSWGINRDIFMLGLARMIDSAGASLLIILIPRYVQHLEIQFSGVPEPFLIGILLSTFGVTNFLTQPYAGVFLDRSGRHRPYLIGGLAIYAVSTGCLLWTTGAVGIFAVRLFQGAGIALTIPATLSLITTYTIPEQRSTAMGFYNIMRMSGFSLGPLAGGTLIQWWGFEIPIIFSAVTAFVGVGMIALLVREPAGKPAVNRKGFLATLSEYFTPGMVDFLKIATGNFAMALSISLISSLQNEFNVKLNQTTFEFSIAFSALLFSMIAVQMPISRLADRYGRKIPIVTGLICLAPVTIWMGYLTSTAALIVARVLQGVTVAAVFAPSVALGGDKADSDSSGRQLSIIGMSFVLGVGVGPALGGVLAGYVTFSAPFWIAALLSLLSAAIIGFTVSDSILSP